MIQESTIQCVPSSPSNEDEPTEPRLPAQRVRTSPTASVLQVRHNGAFTVSIDEQGIVTLVVQVECFLLPQKKIISTRYNQCDDALLINGNGKSSIVSHLFDPCRRRRSDSLR